MGDSFTLGRIGGVKVGVNWSVLVIFALIAYGLSAGRFPDAYPGYGTASYLAAGLATAAVFFGSLLAHELAHAIAARRNGLEVEGITLWLFGGVARLGGEARDPGAELRIAGVGPLVSVLLGAGFLLLAWLLDIVGYQGLVVGGVAWLGAINLALAVFNVIPAAPLDGGRLLRSLVWWRTGDRLRATVVATRAGQVFGWLLVAGGLLAFLAAGNVGGLWLALIGWFLISAASIEGQQATVRGRLGGLAVREVMTPDPKTAPGSMTVADFLNGEYFRYRHSAFPITGPDPGEPEGLVTMNLIKQVPPDRRATTRLQDIACPLDQTPQARPDEPVADLLPRMNRSPEMRALVVDSGRLVGIVSPSDVTLTLEWLSLRRSPGRPGE
ncbi:MAG: site-2 protease family protein [Streptomycetales bacterium]